MLWEVFRPLVTILFFTGLALAVLLVLGNLFPEYSSGTWTWVLYFLGGVAIFFALLRRHKSGALQGGTGEDDASSASEHPAAGTGRELEELRERIRHRKHSKDRTGHQS